MFKLLLIMTLIILIESQLTFKEISDKLKNEYEQCAGELSIACQNTTFDDIDCNRRTNEELFYIFTTFSIISLDETCQGLKIKIENELIFQNSDSRTMRYEDLLKSQKNIRDELELYRDQYLTFNCDERYSEVRNFMMNKLAIYQLAYIEGDLLIYTPNRLTKDEFNALPDKYPEKKISLIEIGYYLVPIINGKFYKEIAISVWEAADCIPPCDINGDIVNNVDHDGIDWNTIYST